VHCGYYPRCVQPSAVAAFCVEHTTRENQKVGRATNKPDMEVEGQVEKIHGKVQKKIGQVEKVLGK
jgi:hypothetical protein